MIDRKELGQVIGQGGAGKRSLWIIVQNWYYGGKTNPDFYKENANAASILRGRR